MDVRNARGIAVMLGAVAGAVLVGGLGAGPVAHAASLPTLPVPPWFQHVPAFDLPGTAGAITNDVRVFIPLFDDGERWDQAYTVPDGSYSVHHIQDHIGFLPIPFLISSSDEVIASDGLAPAVGTTWDEWYVRVYSGLSYTYPLYATSLTTEAGAASIFSLPNLGWDNDFYYGPAGMFDYLVNPNDGTVIPIFEFPADGAQSAAADFSTMWSDLLATL